MSVLPSAALTPKRIIPFTFTPACCRTDSDSSLSNIFRPPAANPSTRRPLPNESTNRAQVE